MIEKGCQQPCDPIVKILLPCFPVDLTRADHASNSSPFVQINTQVWQPTSAQAIYGSNPVDRILNDTNDHNGTSPAARLDEALDNVSADHAYDVAAIKCMIDDALALDHRI